MRRNLSRITGYFEQTVPSYLPVELKHHVRMRKTTFEILSENKLFSKSQRIHLTCEAAANLF